MAVATTGTVTGERNTNSIIYVHHSIAVWWTYDLREDEGEAEPEAWALREAPAARPGHEDEGLADDAHLQVQGRHHRVIVAPQRPHVEPLLQSGNKIDDQHLSRQHQPHATSIVALSICVLVSSDWPMLTLKKLVLVMA
jgi:hypothetical protein